jgi:5-methylcytosine-specific restriction protein A
MNGFPKHVRNTVAARANGFCERCGANTPTQLHHRRPRGMGGSRADDTNTAPNALAVCESCHREIESDRDDALKFGWLVRQGANPGDVPVFRRGQWVVLTDTGAAFMPANGPGRCLKCGFHVPTQQHREGCD